MSVLLKKITDYYRGAGLMGREEAKSKRRRRKRLALLLPGYNEELIIAATIRSAIAAGLSPQDIYVVDDCSSDNTYKEACKELSPRNIITVERSGKAQAVWLAIQHFDFTEKYTWLHIADADSLFCANYFRIYKRNLNIRKSVAAVGFVQSMRGNWISNYRSFSYTYGQHIFRRIQSWFGIISVLPGPVTCFQTNILGRLNFATESLTEDLDLTLQIHRKKLGKIRFIPDAVNFTQDPKTLSDFCKQTARWHRGFFQAIRKYRIGTRPHFIDVGIGYQVSESMFYFMQFFVLTPILMIYMHSWLVWPTALMLDYFVVCILAVLAAIAARRPRILISLSYFYILRFLEVIIFAWSFVEVIILRRFNKKIIGWETQGRRYKLDARVLKDTAYEIQN